MGSVLEVVLPRSQVGSHSPARTTSIGDHPASGTSNMSVSSARSVVGYAPRLIEKRVIRHVARSSPAWQSLDQPGPYSYREDSVRAGVRAGTSGQVPVRFSQISGSTMRLLYKSQRKGIPSNWSRCTAGRPEARSTATLRSSTSPGRCSQTSLGQLSASQSNPAVASPQRSSRNSTASQKATIALMSS